MSDELQTVETTALQAITEGEINQQIATAHKWPRSLAKFNERCKNMIGQDEETAASCIYSRPVGFENGKQKFAEGMSVRMSEIVGAGYGNLRVGAIIIEQTERYVKGRGYAHDLESNFASTSEVIESTVGKNGKPYSERMRIVIAKVVIAKCRRDATFQVVPRALCKALEDLARRVAIGDATTLDKRRTILMDWIGKIGIDQVRVFNALGVNGVEDVGAREMLTLTGLKTAIKENDITADEAFPVNTGKPDVQMPTTKAPTQKQAPAANTTPLETPGTQEKAPEKTPKKGVTLLAQATFAAEVEKIIPRLEGKGIKTVQIQAALIKGGFSADITKAKSSQYIPILDELYGLMGEMYGEA